MLEFESGKTSFVSSPGNGKKCEWLWNKLLPFLGKKNLKQGKVCALIVVLDRDWLSIYALANPPQFIVL